jgi:hypothetical protein
MPSKDRIRELLRYSDGRLYWEPRQECEFKSKQAHKAWHSRFCGKVAGSENTTGYRQIVIDGNKYLVSRLVAAYHGNDIDGLCVVHIDGDFSNNRIENLRLADIREVKRRSADVENDDGVESLCALTCGNKDGVRWFKADGKWQVYATLNRKIFHLGAFSNKADAIACKRQWERANRFTERHGEK